MTIVTGMQIRFEAFSLLKFNLWYKFCNTPCSCPCSFMIKFTLINLG
jgi:hypothetical protein